MAEAPASTPPARPMRSLLWFTTGLLAAAALLSSSCLDRRRTERGDTRDGCAACHGDDGRAGDALLRSAPPRDVLGASDAAYPGVGAHQIHLQKGSTHGQIACDECHIVPDRADSPGHADDRAPAEVVFGALARTGGVAPTYDPVARRCSDSYCHRGAEAVWTEPRDSAAACGSCHGLPPPAPHPGSTQCWTCHGDVIDERSTFRAPELHVNGRVELGVEGCARCHGSGEHGAPPPDTRGNTARSAMGVGAHTAHLSGGTASRALSCNECHQVPDAGGDLSHADGLPAEVVLSGVAQTNDHEPLWQPVSETCSDSWCHGPGRGRGASSPRWTSTTSLGCSDCHGLPPAAPHPQMTDCSACHEDVVASDDRTIAHPDRHVDGQIQVSLATSCTACHGDDNSAPPRALDGETKTTASGVGAHQIHLAGTARSRPVPCGECHVVPRSVMDPGHVDTLGPAEVVFSGASAAFGATPEYANGTCSNTACHGDALPRGHDSGGSLTTPEWTLVDGTQGACGTCHGLPPPRPHPYYSDDCGRCHKNMSPDGATFLRPDLHVDGLVTFEL